AAFSLLSYLTNQDTSLQIVLDPHFGGGVTRRDQFGSPTRWYGFGLDPGATVSFLNTLRSTLTHPGIKNPVLRLRTPDEESHRKILDKALRAALLENKDAAACLKEVAPQWETLDKQLPEGEARKRYLISLGLQP